MPWTPKQNRLFRARCHGFKKGTAGKIKKADACRMAHEGVKKKPAAKRRRR